MIKIAMWSGPRSISTALMRSFENRSDTFVSDEPFYAHYLYETGEDHPYSKETIQDGERIWDNVTRYITGNIPNGKKIWYQKHMAQHNLTGKDLSWIEEMKNVLLIRHPKEVILSYIKKYKIKSIDQLGYPQQTALLNFLSYINGLSICIIDANDVLTDPEGMLKQLCNKLNIPFYKEMLSWPAGRRESDGVWGKHWYSSVEKSTGFQSVSKNKGTIPKDLKGIYKECMEHYQQHYKHRIKLS